ncbi:unnamed protein product, partial [Nesidiocoris tenuis]
MIFTKKPLISYLTQFGYLPESDRETGFLRTESQLRESIKNLQRFGNIPETGEMDDKTLDLMSRPRCGIPDIPNFYKRRRRRFAVHGEKWHTTRLSWRFNGTIGACPSSRQCDLIRKNELGSGVNWNSAEDDGEISNLSNVEVENWTITNVCVKGRTVVRSRGGSILYARGVRPPEPHSPESCARKNRQRRNSRLRCPPASPVYEHSTTAADDGRISRLAPDDEV